MPFQLPEELPTGIEDLGALRDAAATEYARLREIVESGDTLSDSQLEELRYVVDARKTLSAAYAAAEAAGTERENEIAELFAAGDADETEETDEDEVLEVVEVDDEVVTPDPEPVVAAATPKVPAKRTSFAGTGKGKTAHIPRGTGATDNVGFRMRESMIGYKEGLVGFADIAKAIDAVKGNHRPRGPVTPGADGFNNMGLFHLERAEMPPIHDAHELVAAIEAATALDKMRRPKFDENGSLTAAGGWCAPSEQLYDFCAVPLASDLLALPEITINRGGVRWPIEPDLSTIFDNFEFFFTEPELEALPAPVKTCVEIPCPDEFKEIRLSAVGYCVEAGILQTQGWPELIQWFMESITQEHFRAMSRRSILDMVSDSTPVNMNAAALGVSASSSVLNSIDLMAVNLRLNKGYARNHPIEAVAPNWLHNVIRADFANQMGLDIKSVTDAQIDAWFAARNISFQFVADWQTRSAGMPGNLATVQWPGAVSILMYPAGTWFRALQPVIEFGIQYPRELLQINRYSRFFTEDAYAISRRCDESLVVTIPTCVNGGYGGPITVSCNAPANEVQSVATTGTPTGGTISLTFQGQTTAPIAYNAAASAIQSALEALSNVNVGDVTVTGGALPVAAVVTFGGRFAGANVPKMTVTSALTGGTNASAVVTVITEGAS